jgi:flavin reductase (DIM6/NTAB) family NADH-FMN oxidoreductase RutF
VELDFAELSPGRAYRYLISAVVPRPIAFVSTLSPDGTRNLAPFSYYMAVCSRPPLLALSILRRGGGHKDTARNILETGEFVVNASTEELARAVNLASGDYAPHYDEFALTGLTAAPSRRVRPSRVAESPLQMECRLHRSLDLGEEPFCTTLLLGEILVAHVRDDLWEEAMVRADRLRPLARLGANLYSTLGRILAMDRPAVDAEGNPLAGKGPEPPG